MCMCIFRLVNMMMMMNNEFMNKYISIYTYTPTMHRNQALSEMKTRTPKWKLDAPTPSPHLRFIFQICFAVTGTCCERKKES